MVATMSPPSARAAVTTVDRPASREPVGPRPAEDPVAVADALGIPWRSLLEAEIQAERTLRGFLGEPGAEVPLWRFLSALPTTALDSWRVRERLAALLREARLARSGVAVRSVRQAIDELCGKRAGSDGTETEALTQHLRLAYERVRELSRVARVAERIRGERGERLARIVAKTGCTAADATWGVARAEGAGRTHAVDDAVRQARAEGFEIPRAGSEFHAFLQLRKLVRAKGSARRRLPSGSRREAAASGTPEPHRVTRRLAS